MRTTAIARIRARYRAYLDLVRDSSEPTLYAEVPVAKNKTVREHLWCVIGARESYTRALAAGTWCGFSCSLERSDRPELLERLQHSAAHFDATVARVDEWTAARDELLIDLLEHEVMHEGQIIRQVYALGGSLPESWRWA